MGGLLKSKLERGGAFSDKVAAAEAAYLRRVDSACGNVATVARSAKTRLAVQSQSHFAAENNVRGVGWMGVCGIESIWAVGPGVGVRKAFALQLSR
jgi:hypothetical protein